MGKVLEEDGCNCNIGFFMEERVGGVCVCVCVCEGLGRIYMWFSLSFSLGWDNLDQTLSLCGISIFCLTNVFFLETSTCRHSHKGARIRF